jgi:hypothetical protein
METEESIVKIERNVPPLITDEHRGAKILYRLPNNAIAVEGTIDELSPGGDYIHCGKRWIPNDGKSVLAVLSGPQRRREAIK